MSISVAVITCGPSDLLALLQKSPALTVEVLHPNALTPHCLDGFQCACVLGGTREEPLVFPAECRSVVEDFSHSGRRVLYEYTLSFCQNYCASPDSTRFLRLVCTDAEFAGLEDGLLLDDQCNMRCTPYYRNNLARPILMYKKGLSEHARQPLSQQERTDCQQYGIWLETPAVAVCSFRLCNFLRARFSPVPAWSRLVRSLIGWLCGAPVLEGCAARFECRHAARFDGGDHLICVGEVLRFTASEAEPLVYHRGAYRGLAAEGAVRQG